MGYFCPKNTFLQLKHYIQRIYLTLLSTTCVKIHQITHVIFETISYFSRQNFSVFFQFKHYILSAQVAHQSANFQTFHCSVKVHQIPHVIFQTKSQFYSKFGFFFQCHERSFFCTFLAKPLYAIDKVALPSANFQTCHCLH